MATKLRDLKITKVDFVDAGANPGASIQLFKRRDDQGGDDRQPDGAIKKMLDGITGEGLKVLARIAKAVTFGEKLTQRKRGQIVEEIWDVCYALEGSLTSIIYDDEVPGADRAALMEQSLNDFSAVVKELIPAWGQGMATSNITKAEPPMTPARLKAAKAAKERLEAIIAKEEDQGEPAGPVEPDPPNTMKGVQDNMRIDKSKLTPEELAALEAIEKKAGIPEGSGQEPADPVAKGDDGKPGGDEGGGGSGQDKDADDIYKGLHPAIRAELESLRKFCDDMKDRELHQVAKRYEIIGRKPEELVPVLKSLRAAGGDAYDQMIAVLEAGVEAFEKSGLFSEIGKRGVEQAKPWQAIEKKAAEIMKAQPDLTRAQAIDKACEQHPELVAEYENDR